MFEKQQMSECEKDRDSSLTGGLFITISEATVILQLDISFDLH